ncbi:MAG: hypothetical protein OXG04_23320 [Acidobacteria bacterium]|nr:hypothetical protein [Acidobacteriota bacterium]
MQSVNRALLWGVMVLLAAATACGGGEEEEAAAAAAAAEAEVEVSPEARAAADRLAERLAAGISLVPTQRGQAEIGYTQPTARRGTGQDRGFNITSIRIRNVSQNAIAGFQVDEFWYDGDGNTVTGDQARRRLPILVDEVCDIELRVPVVSAMDRSNYEFSHQNGDIKATLLEDIEFPPQPEVEEGEEGEEAAAAEEAEEGEEELVDADALKFTCLRPVEGMQEESAAAEDGAAGAAEGA